MTRPCLLLAFVLGMAQQAVAQVDLIVKVGDASSASGRLLAGAVSKLGDGTRPDSLAEAIADDELLQGVSQIQPLFPGTDSLSRGSGSGLGKRNGLDGIYLLTMADSTSLTSALERWSRRQDVAYAISNHRYSLDGARRPEDQGALPQEAQDYNDTHFDSLRHLQLIRAPEAWTVTRGNPSVRIGVIDTGVFKDHPDLRTQFWVNPVEDLNSNGILDEGDLNGVDDDGNGYVDDVVGFDFVDRTAAVDPGDYLARDPDASEDRLSPLGQRRGGFGHGTLVTGVVSAALDNEIGIAGVAPDARLVPIRAFGIDGLAEDDDVAAAIVYAADIGLDVINLSFGDTYYSPLMADAIRYAASVGTIVVASGGNSGSDDPHYPSDYPEAIGALWLDGGGEQRGSRASFGLGIDVGAPASFVFTTLLPPPDDLVDDPDADSVLYGYRSGSSLAAPQIAGAAALLRSVDPDLTPASVKAILTGTAFDLSEPGWDYETAAGRVDLAAAVGLPYPASVTITQPEHDSGFAGNRITVRGSALSPLFDSYSVWFGIEADGEEPEWQLVAGPVVEQKREEILADWILEGLPDTTYVLRLEVTLKNGQTIENRRRVFIDRSPPELEIITFESSLVGPAGGVQIELISSDLSEATLLVEMDGQSFLATSERRVRRLGHGLVWADPTGRGGPARATVKVTNVAGLSSTVGPVDVLIPAMPNPGYLDEFETGLPAGFLLPRPTDVDSDGLPEAVFNRYQEGWLGDTVRVAEWAGDRFRPLANLITNTFPRSTGDTDGDGNPEILLQVSAVTQVAEFSDNAGRVEIVFVDTAGINNPSAENAAWGALLSDLDGDGRGEIVTHNRKAWRLFEYASTNYTLVATLENPTPLEEAMRSGLLGSEANGFAEPEAVAGDFDRDGRGDLFVSDSDGDFIVFEATGDNTYEAVWFHLTSRFNSQGSRLAEGDFDGDGNRELVGYTHSWPDPRLDGEYDAPYGVYYFFEAAGDNDYRIRDSLVVTGELNNHGSLAAVDFDGDDADELVIAHPPDLYVLKPDREDRWKVLFHRGDMGTDLVSGVRSISMTPGDFDLDGVPEILVAGADESIHRFEWSASGARLPPPAWISATALDARTIRLAWRSGEADSVAVYRRSDDGDFDRIAVTANKSLVDSTGVRSVYTLSAFYGAERSSLSAEREVRPHNPVPLVDSAWREDFLVFTFAGTLPDKVDRALIRLSDGQRAVSAQSAGTSVGTHELIVRFDPSPTEGDTVFWNGLVDSEGTPVADPYALVPARAESEIFLYLTGWEAISIRRARLVFSLPLDPGAATNTENYRIDPTGSVASAEVDPSRPEAVLVDVTGRALGPTGLRTSIVVLDMMAADGSRLAAEGTVATFAGSAESLSEAYVFPNPYRSDQHGPFIMIAGLPNRSTIEIFSLTGAPIRRLEERDGDGGVAWDLTDESGSLVGSGVYIIRVETESEESVMLKSAVIR